jgi:hypothetical protein
VLVKLDIHILKKETRPPPPISHHIQKSS